MTRQPEKLMAVHLLLTTIIFLISDALLYRKQSITRII